MMGDQKLWMASEPQAGPRWGSKQIAVPVTQRGGTRHERSIFPASNPSSVCVRVPPGCGRKLDGGSCPPPSASVLLVGC